MLSEDRMILMTRMASYEANEGKKNMAIGNYFRSDYLTVQVLKAIACGTISYFIIFGLYMLYHFESFMQELYDMDIIAFARKVLLYYGITVCAYALITGVVAVIRYVKAEKNLRRYYQNLKALGSSMGSTHDKKSVGGTK